MHVFVPQASEFISIFTEFPNSTSAWDDYAYFDRLQTQLEDKRGLTASDPNDMSAYLTPIQLE